MAGLGTGVPITLKCSTCKKSHHTYTNTRGESDWSAETGKLWRTGKSKPRTASKGYLAPRMTRTLYELYCSMCGEYMWSAHMDAERKPLITITKS